MEQREESIKEGKEEEEIVIVGGGIAGLATALALERVGLKSRVLERHSELRATGGALNLFPNAWFALRALEVDHKLASIYQKHYRSYFTKLETWIKQELNSKKAMNRDLDVRTRTVHRKALLQTLAEELPADTIRFSSKLISIKNETTPNSAKNTSLYLEDGTVIKAKVVIGCDGVHSVVAQWLGLSRPIDSGLAAFRGLSVYPEGHEIEQSQQYFARGMRAAYIPLNSKEIHWFLLHHSSSLENDMPTSPELILKEVTENLAEDFPSDFLAVVKNTESTTVTWAPLLSRPPWNVALGPTRNGSVTVTGDAMHPMFPDLGQGGCSALEDAVILAHCLSRARNNNGSEWPEEGLKRYVKERRWRVTWQVAGSWFVNWVQQRAAGDDEGWWSTAVKWFRDHFFYRFCFPWIMKYCMKFDSGDLIPPRLGPGL